MRKFYFLVLGLLFISGVKAQIVNIPDANFKAELIRLHDTNNNGEIEVDEALQVEWLSIGNKSISSLEGISSFKNLTGLQCQNNQLTTLDVSGLSKLDVLYCQQNMISSINLDGLINLRLFLCHTNKLTSLSVNNLINLKGLDCGNNQISLLDISNLSILSDFSCVNNQLSKLDFTGLYNIQYLYCTDNKISSLELSSLSKLDELYCENNQLNLLNIKNGRKESQLNFSGNSNLQFICADDTQINSVQDLISQYSYTNCTVNSYCSFVPGGKFYTIQGNNKYDSNNNGCDVLDLPLSNLKISITDETNNGSVITNTTGNYNIPVQAGTHTVAPVLESPSYFTVSPTNSVVTFPTQVSPFIQDFCIIPNGVHPDLEVTVLSLNRARPGFDASYKIIYKNKGTNTQSGSVNLAFDDAVLDLINANPIATTQSTNNLSWNFTDLKPFEIREIELKVNVNSPIETPAVNIDDILSYTATITSTQTDETPTDNSFALNQTVVGSFDPNDKTCLEGATIPPSAVGKYVHYLIRFENKGTAEAQNVVVKDMIDTSKFDVNSLVVTQGSHPFVTRITETNKVEFIFENINLPFNDATNDGYVAFKIKTKPSLVVGDSFSNTASIYFDYNFPIITNTATTSVLQSLGSQDFEFDSYFSVYPNPAKNSLNVDIKKQIKVSSISIYNTLGQQILVIPNAQYTKQVDVSNLKTGNYFIKLTSDKGSSVGKFIKS